MEKIRAHVWISGRVQGVGYRYHTEQTARQANLAGWVRNLQDGRVEAVFEGDRADIEAMLRWCYMGSPGAVVTSVDVAYEAVENLVDFQTRRSV
ncbi:MAG TPA: acylphosphatase [Leptolyngbyaceae cyanobacterium M33_DOE_097]|uniref:acylphosphatase n=1 Tax=Oscillatoriales cyanobacterium SpSt-418 TaxID=2282169 RepID=A0A7C3KE94_9CYAN|nr:acylphosphatase [Leptolyngbyaceae cyanobacterium M33_DOE_097]